MTTVTLSEAWARLPRLLAEVVGRRLEILVVAVGHRQDVVDRLHDRLR